MDYAADCIQGAREGQQDEFGIIDGDDLMVDGESLKVFVVADGMGGHNSGEEASAAAVLGFVHHFAETQGPVSDRLRATLDAANQKLHQRIQDEASLSGMGTTLIAAAVTPTTLQWISVGDSKLRLYRAATEELQLVNADHSMAPVVEALERDDRSAAGLDKHALRSALLGEDIPMVDLSSQPLNLQPDDVVLLASDGLDVLSEEEIRTILAGARQQGAKHLVQLLLKGVQDKRHPDQDNATVIVVVPRGGAAGSSNLMPTRSIAIPSWALVPFVVAALALLALVLFFGNESVPDAIPESGSSEIQEGHGSAPDSPAIPSSDPETVEPDSADMLNPSNSEIDGNRVEPPSEAANGGAQQESGDSDIADGVVDSAEAHASAMDTPHD